VDSRPFTASWRPPEDGVYDFRVLSYDRAGNASLDLATDVYFNAPPRFTLLSPEPRLGSAGFPPLVSFKVVDENDGIEASSVSASLNGIKPAKPLELSPVPGGYRGSLVPDLPLPAGSTVEVWLEAVDGEGVPAATSFLFYIGE